MNLLAQLDRESDQQVEHKRGIVQHIKKQIQKVIQSTCVIQLNEHSYNQTIISFLLESKFNTIRYKIQIKINFVERCVVYKCRLIKNGSYLILRSNQIRINFLHKRILPIQRPEISVINVDNGQIFISITHHYIEIIQKKQLLTKEVISKCAYLEKEVNFNISLIFQAINEDICIKNKVSSEVYHESEETMEERLLNVQMIKKYINFSQVDLGLSERPSQYSTPSEDTVNIRKEKLQKVQNESYQTQIYLQDQQSNDLYQYRQNIRQNMKSIQEQFTDSRAFQSLLKIEPMENNQRSQDVYILNEISIQNIREYATYKMSQKSVVKMYDSILRYMQVQKIVKRNGITFNLVADPEPHHVIQNNKKCINKMLLIKDYVRIQGNKQETRDKVLHDRIQRLNKQRESKLVIEKNIVKMFNFGKSPYFMKYYYSDQPEYMKFKDSVIMQFNITTSLSQFLSIHRSSMSLNSKLLLLSHISNALRFLLYYGITHMDLNVNNILVSEQLRISFPCQTHTSLKIRYQPGYTLPFTAPQFFTQDTFSPSYDMFSFGMIIFGTLFNYYPLPQHKLMQQQLKNRSYHSRLLLTPESIYQKGNAQCWLLLMKLVNKCFSSEQQQRPLPIWTTIILKQVLALHKNGQE